MFRDSHTPARRRPPLRIGRLLSKISRRRSGESSPTRGFADAGAEFGIKNFVADDLAMFNEPVYVGAAVSNGAMLRAEIVPDQQVAASPIVDIAIFGLELLLG